MAVELRAANAGDERAIKQMIHAARINPMQLDWRRFYVIVDDSGRVAACGQVKPHGDGTRELASLVVLEELRGQGLARCIMEKLMTLHGPPLYLTCNSSLVPLYRRFGFYTLEKEQMPPYFRRISALVDILVWLLRWNEHLAVMRWDGPES
jgi:N-acetylglutamate synthase-like GNAT family acetyltransferase